jgi:hypothetical protein
MRGHGARLQQLRAGLNQPGETHDRNWGIPTIVDNGASGRWPGHRHRCWRTALRYLEGGAAIDGVLVTLECGRRRLDGNRSVHNPRRGRGGWLGIEALVDAAVRLGDRPGASRPGRKVLSLIHAMLLGADCIDDCDMLRAGRAEAVLGHKAMAPSTLGTFLRSLSFGHVRQLDRVLAEALKRAWQAGAAGQGSLGDRYRQLRR